MEAFIWGLLSHRNCISDFKGKIKQCVMLWFILSSPMLDLSTSIIVTDLLHDHLLQRELYMCYSIAFPLSSSQDAFGGLDPMEE